MPYSMDTLPDAVKKLTAEKQAQWLEVWNSAYSSCTEKNGDKVRCEQSAFAQAWGVVGGKEEEEEEEEYPSKEETGVAEAPVEAPAETPDEETVVQKLSGLLKFILDTIKGIVGVEDKTAADKNEEIPVKEIPKEAQPKDEQNKYLPQVNQQRSLSFPAIYDQVMTQLKDRSETAMLYDVYWDDGGLFAICAADGKVYKQPITLDNSVVTLGDWEEILVEQSSKPSFRIIRTESNRYRWISISATAVLNRSGEIDSRQLFDNFIKHAEDTGKYPIRDFFHAGNKFRTGQCDFLGRDENVLITSGLYDETPLAMREVKVRLEEPEYWGDSISFYPLSPAQKIRAGTAEIPVFTDGLLESIATLPEKDAASWLTATPTIQEVNRMLSQRQLDAFIKLFDNDEEQAKAWLSENTATRNKVIVDTGMVTRAKRELAKILDEGALETKVEVPVVPEAAPAAPTSVIDDQTFAVFTERFVERMNTAITEALNPVGAQLTAIGERVQALEERFNKTQSETTQNISQALSRLNLLTKTDEEKKRDWMADVPAPAKPAVSHRPSETRTSDREQPVTEVLDRIPIKY